MELHILVQSDPHKQAIKDANEQKTAHKGIEKHHGDTPLVIYHAGESLVCDLGKCTRKEPACKKKRVEYTDKSHTFAQF
jgi:hypothetical protein